MMRFRIRQPAAVTLHVVLPGILWAALVWGAAPEEGVKNGITAPIGAMTARVLDFEEHAGQWQGRPRPDQLRMAPGVSRGRAHHIAELRLARDREAMLAWRQPIDLSGYDTLRFDVFVPRTKPHVHFSVYFIDEDSFWFQTWRPLIPLRDRWHTLQVDLRAETAELQSRKHGRPWGPYVARGVKEMGIALFADDRTTAVVGVDRVILLPAKNLEGGRRPQKILNFETNGAEIPCHRKFEITFKLTRTYENPFDPNEIEVWGRFRSPSRKLILVPGFFYQDYARTLDRKVERLIPVGAPKWKIRFAPREVGPYTYEVEVLDGERLKTGPARFVSVPSGERGFVRVCRDDATCFEFEDGSFYYPIGHNIPATFNSKGASLLGIEINPFVGTFAYDRFLDGMSRGKENYARIWLASWSFGLEWSRSYHPSYRGLGRYNQEHAWRMDYVLDKAGRLGIYTQLALTTFGHWRRGTQFEGDWRASPYNVRNGGHLKWPEQFWSDEPAQKLYDRMVRYVMARWGYATHIAAWELSNEIDLVTNYKQLKPLIIRWHKRCAATIRRFDPNPHLITTNFAIAGNDPDLLALPEISFSSTNHYNVNIIRALRKSIYPLKARYGKPAIMAECGYDFKGALPETTERYLHLCVWGTYMMPFGGNGLSWWWGFIDDRDLYHMFRPIANFDDGEDRRRRGLAMADGTLRTQAGQTIGGLAAIALQNDHSGYFWVYERRLLRAESDYDFTPEPREDVVLRLGGFKDGEYQVEFWDTLKGERIQTVKAQASSNTLECPVPAFTGDIAGKVKAAAGDSEISPREKGAEG